jgi:probable phosphoglycerate mutase
MADQTLAFFLRHGSTTLNDTGAFRGESNPPLDDHGSQDAIDAKEFLGNTEFGEIIGSDKLRVQQTAETVLNSRNLEPHYTSKLRAWNVGYLTGMNKEEHAGEIDHYQANPDVRIPKGESLNEFRGRVSPVIKFAIKRGMETGLPSLVIAHSSVIHQVGEMLHGDHEAALVHPGGIAAVKLGPKGLYAEPVFKPENKKVGYGS